MVYWAVHQPGQERNLQRVSCVDWYLHDWECWRTAWIVAGLFIHRFYARDFKSHTKNLDASSRFNAKKAAIQKIKTKYVLDFYIVYLIQFFTSCSATRSYTGACCCCLGDYFQVFFLIFTFLLFWTCKHLLLSNL